MTPLILLALLAVPQETAPVVIARDADQPQLAADRDGTFYCTFIRNGNIELSMSTDNGGTWSTPVTAIDARGKARGGMQRGPRIGIDDKKVITITVPHDFVEKELDLWIVRSTDGGRTFTAPVRINGKPGTAPEALHALAVAPSGEAHVSWLDMRGRDKGQDLYYAKVVDGKPGKNIKIAESLCECCAPGMAVSGKGFLLVLWRDGVTADNRSISASASKDGGENFTPLGRMILSQSGVAG